MGLKYETTKRGEMYMMSQGSGGGYGDVLERDPQLVMKDLEEQLVSHDVAARIYKVVYDKVMLTVDVRATEKARDKERKARIRRGKPFKTFVKKWVKPGPPKGLPYYGCWADPTVMYTGSVDTSVTRDNMAGVLMPDPKDVQITALHDEIAKLKKNACRRSK
jgi:hypothetical protein